MPFYAYIHIYFPKKDYITYFSEICSFYFRETTHIFPTVFSPRCLILCYTYVISTVEIIIGFVTNFDVTDMLQLISVCVCVHIYINTYVYTYSYCQTDNHEVCTCKIHANSLREK